MSARVYVGRLPNAARERDVEKFFSGFGKLREVLMKNGYCFVEFDHTRDAEDAISDLDGKSLCGERVIVQMARARKSNDDRGGRGGRDGRDGRDRRPYRSRSPRDRKRSPRRRSVSNSPPQKRRDSRSESRSPIPKRDKPSADKKTPRSPSGSPNSLASE